jgi:molybdopterin converting factor small subunit
MKNADDPGNSGAIEELIDQTQGPRADIIHGVQFYGGEAHTQQLRGYSNIPSGRYHFHKLEDQDIIEKVGEEHIGQGGAATVYQLTDFGHEVADALDESPNRGTTVTELEDKIEEQSEEIQELQERYNTVIDYIEKLENQINTD